VRTRDRRTEAIRIAIYRRMAPEQKLLIAAKMYDDAVQVVRDSVRDQHPEMSAEEAEIEVRRRVFPRGTPEVVIRGHCR